MERKINMNDQYEDNGLDSGFTEKQLQFLEDWFAKQGHTHSIDEVDGLEETLEGMEEEGDEE